MTFFLPDFFYNYTLNLTLIKLIKEHPDFFYDDIKIGAIYGSFPQCIWNGGRAINGAPANLSTIKHIIETINNEDVAIRFTYTNCLIDTQHLMDYYCNTITSMAHNGKNDIIVNSPILEEFLRKNYPNYKYILSTTKMVRDIDLINEATEKYDLVVPDYRDNMDDNFLQKLKNKEHIELLINAYCSPTCPYRAEHYKDLSRIQLEFGEWNENSSCYANCPNIAKSFYHAMTFKTNFTIEDIHNKLIPMGFSNFKIEGRNTHPFDVIESYLYYMVKPECQYLVRDILIHSVWSYGF